MLKYKIILASLIVATFVLYSFFGYCGPSLAETKAFDIWSGIVNQIPKQSSYSDPLYEKSWYTLNGQQIKVQVRKPLLDSTNREIKIKPGVENQDSTPVFSKALKHALLNHAVKIKVESGTYHFYSLTDSTNFPSKGLAHIYLEGFHDFVFDGGGATFVFHNNKPGFLIQHSQRVQIKNLNIKFLTGDKTIAEVAIVDGRKVLKIEEAANQLKSIDLYQVIQINSEKSRFVTNGKRFVFAPGAISPPNYLGGGMFYHELFNSLEEGSKFLLLHYWYGAQAIKIDGDRTVDETEDITLSDLNIYSTPGMAVTTTGLKRGLAVINSSFGSLDGDITQSPSWDALNVHNGGGDFYIVNNKFYFTTDDGINLYTPIHKIKKIDIYESKITLMVSSRFINVGDYISFFNEEGEFKGQFKVLSKSKDLGDGVFEFGFNQLPSQINKDWVIRDINLVQGRFYISNNYFQYLSGHAILAQTINGLIENNIIKDITRNPIRLLSSVGTWREGVGVFNVTVKGNSLENTGTDWDGNVPWSAISLYSIKNKHQLSSVLVNENVEIADNIIINPLQDCITISNSRNVKITGNICKSNSIPTSILNKINIIRSENVKSEN